MVSKSQAIISEIKELKEKNKITYSAILDELKVNEVQTLSLTTLRRVFASGSENRASGFNYEETLLPIRDALRRIDGSPDTPEAREIENLREIISSQHEELDRTLELKEHLDDRNNFLTAQIAEKDAMIKRLMDRLDQKDEIIQQFIVDLRQKDALLNCVMGRLKKYENTEN